MTFEALRRPSLVRRLVILAAGWSLAVLVASALVLAMLFQQAALRRFDQGLSEMTDNLLAGTTIAEGGQVVAPALTDLRALRAYSGKYWQMPNPWRAVVCGPWSAPAPSGMLTSRYRQSRRPSWPPIPASR